MTDDMTYTVHVNIDTIFIDESPFLFSLPIIQLVDVW